MKKDELTREDVVKLKDEECFTFTQIAEMYYSNYKAITRLYRGEYKYPFVKKICQKCGKIYYSAPHSPGKNCYRKECYEKRIYRQKKNPDKNKVRPYTDASLNMIVKDIYEGRSIDWMAQLYSRDKNDLEKFVKKIKKDGTYEETKDMLLEYREYAKRRH